jgi:hypothetical protein
MRWSVVSLVGGSSNVGQTHQEPDEHAEEMTLSNAKAAPRSDCHTRGYSRSNPRDGYAAVIAHHFR